MKISIPFVIPYPSQILMTGRYHICFWKGETCEMNGLVLLLFLLSATANQKYQNRITSFMGFFILTTYLPAKVLIW